MRKKTLPANTINIHEAGSIGFLFSDDAPAITSERFFVKVQREIIRELKNLLPVEVVAFINIILTPVFVRFS